MITLPHWKRGVTTVLSVTAVAPLTICVAGCSHTSSVDRGAYVAANHHLFSQLPRYPQARSLREVTTAYREDDSGPVVGYSTRFELAVPPEATANDLRAFFTGRLGARWRLVENLEGHVLNFRRGEEFVSINLHNVGLHRLEIAVDHAFYGKPRR